MPKGGSRPVTRQYSSTTYCNVRMMRPIGIAAYGIHNRARHTVSESHRSLHASCQYDALSTTMTTQKLIAISIVTRASQ